VAPGAVKAETLPASPLVSLLSEDHLSLGHNKNKGIVTGILLTAVMVSALLLLLNPPCLNY